MSQLILVDPAPRRALAQAGATADPRREMWLGATLGGALLVGFGGWAALSQLDAAVIASGVVRAGETRTQVQTPTGGVVTQVFAGNGARVRKGAALVEFSVPEAVAQERALASRVLGLHAEIARIHAHLRGAAEIGPVAAFAGLTGEDRALAMAALAGERAQLAAERSVAASESGASRDRRDQIRHQISAMSARLESSRRQEALNDQELAANQSLLDRGLTTRTRVLALQRAAAAYNGEASEARAEIARLRSQSQEVGMQTAGSRGERLRTQSDRLRIAQTELQTLLPQWRAARADRSRATVRAPFDGVISATEMPARENVLAPGAVLFEVVPSAPSYTVEARVTPADAAELAAGQTAQIRFATLRVGDVEPVEARIERVSADSIQDQRTGESFYTVQMRVSGETLVRAGKLAHVAGGVRPGTPVEVTVSTHPRSALSYLLSPLTRRLGRVFSEQ